jgi:hypothetical protein
VWFKLLAVLVSPAHTGAPPPTDASVSVRVAFLVLSRPGKVSASGLSSFTVRGVMVIAGQCRLQKQRNCLASHSLLPMRTAFRRGRVL